MAVVHYEQLYLNLEYNMMPKILVPRVALWYSVILIMSCSVIKNAPFSWLFDIQNPK